MGGFSRPGLAAVTRARSHHASSESLASEPLLDVSSLSEKPCSYQHGSHRSINRLHHELFLHQRHALLFLFRGALVRLLKHIVVVGGQQAVGPRAPPLADQLSILVLR